MTTEDTSVLPLREPVLCLGTLLISPHLSGLLPDAQACTRLREQSLPVLVVSPTFTATKGVSAAVPSRPACMLAVPAPCRHGLHVENCTYEVRSLRCL